MCRSAKGVLVSNKMDFNDLDEGNFADTELSDFEIVQLDPIKEVIKETNQVMEKIASQIDLEQHDLETQRLQLRRSLVSSFKGEEGLCEVEEAESSAEKSPLTALTREENVRHLELNFRNTNMPSSSGEETSNEIPKEMTYIEKANKRIPKLATKFLPKTNFISKKGNRNTILQAVSKCELLKSTDETWRKSAFKALVAYPESTDFVVAWYSRFSEDKMFAIYRFKKATQKGIKLLGYGFPDRFFLSSVVQSFSFNLKHLEFEESAHKIDAVELNQQHLS
mmetsp:Transcript_15047/g.21882  ORF Transcript_15047/g.21882 Transcript_15047/m.21882 type:complete len:280 (+) Transcript_15047:600-1439(+)